MSPDVSLTQDEGFVETSDKGLTYPMGRFAPAEGTLHRLSPDVRWARIQMPGSLGHINNWVIDDGDGVAVVDTGMKLPSCQDNWEAILAGELAGVPVTRVIGTHFHPDHIGLAGLFAERFGASIWMTRGEWLTIQMACADARPEVPDEVNVFRRAIGWTETQIEAGKSEGWGRLREMILPLPISYHRLREGEILEFPQSRWRVVIGSGHSPEHACLLNEADGILISGDQLLPRISSNVSLGVTEPDADPLGEWLASIDKLKTLPSDLLVLPAHGEPFRGLHTRLDALRDEHRARLDDVERLIADRPSRVVDCFPALFRRTIGPESMGLASGEALAHLRRLEIEGRAKRTARDGIWWFDAIA